MLHIAVASEPEPIVIARTADLADWYVLSPYVMTDRNGRFTMLVRLVNRDDDAAKKISRIYLATSDDGVHFTLGPQIIAPGEPDSPDDAGCEDPTVLHDGEEYVVLYSGLARATGASVLMSATGSTLDGLQKRGAFISGESFANNKEAALVRTPSGVRLFFEYAADNASHIGAADAATLAGPWMYGTSAIKPRPAHFDSHHLSPASAVRLADHTNILFYNGANQSAQWRIAWIHLDATAETVLGRSENALISAFDRRGDDRDMAFVASTPVIGHDRVALYYSVSDQYLYRTIVTVPGARADATQALLPS